MQPVNKFGGESASSLSAKGTLSAKTISSQTVPSEKAQLQNLSRSVLRQVLNSSGLPADKLSSSIISFARFFSLPLKPNLMANIRRQAFAQQSNVKQNSAQQSGVQQNNALFSSNETQAADKLSQNREALSFAAAAAESKGVELKESALENYAEVIDPAWQQRQDEGGRKHRNKNKNKQTETEEAEPIAAAAVKKAALESADENPLLSILNKLSGKDGQRWFVFPFDFSKDGKGFKVSLRMLLAPPSGESVPDYIVLDITENGDEELRQVFALSSVNGAAQRLSVFLQYELSEKDFSIFKKHTVYELSALLGINPECVSVKAAARDSAFPFETELGENLLCSIDKDA